MHARERNIFHHIIVDVYSVLLTLYEYLLVEYCEYHTREHDLFSIRGFPNLETIRDHLFPCGKKFQSVQLYTVVPYLINKTIPSFQNPLFLK